MIPAKVRDAWPGALGMIAMLTAVGGIASIASAIMIRLVTH